MTRMKLVPCGRIEFEEAEGKPVKQLDGGTITLFPHDGKWGVEVEYETMRGYGTHMGPFSSPEDAVYRMTHGVVPKRLAALLFNNGILVKEEA